MDGEFSISRYTLLHIEWRNSKALLLRNYIQYPVINSNGKEYEKEYMCVCVCVPESLCYRAEINMAL